MTQPRSLRLRLTLQSIAVSLLLVGGAAAATVMLLEQAHWAALDAELGEEVETLCILLDAAIPHDVARATEAIARERSPGPGKFVLLEHPSGSLIATAGRMPPLVDLRVHLDRDEIRAMTMRTQGQRYRVVWRAHGTECQGAVGLVVDDQVRRLQNVRLAVAAGGVLLLACFSALTWVTTGRAAAQLDRLADEIEAIEATDLHRRLRSGDVLEVERLAGVLNRLLARLDAAMDRLRVFAANAAHELRTPLAALRARLEVTLSSPGGGQVEYRDGLLDALVQTERLERLSEDLLSLGAIELGGTGEPMERVDLHSIAADVVESLEVLAQEEHRSLTLSSGGAVWVVGAPALLRRLLSNLVDNAFRHTPHTSAIEVRVFGDPDSGIIEVHDQGPGIALADLAHVFERFHRARRSGSGSGLGLALCREIVAAHRGTIDLESTPERGTTVVIRLPRDPARPIGAVRHQEGADRY